MKNLLLLVLFVFCAVSTSLATPAAPQMSYSLNGLNLSVVWSQVPEAAGYTLYYAPYPYTGPETIGSMGMGETTSFNIDLWAGAAYYIAVKAYNDAGESGFSNIEYFIMANDIDFEGLFIQSLPECPAGPVFTHPIIDIDRIKYITPLGNVGGHVEPTDHHYVEAKTPFDPSEEIDIFAPSDMVIRDIMIQTQVKDNGRQTIMDYGLRAYACSDLKVDIGHITYLSQDLIDRSETMEEQCNPLIVEPDYTIKQCFKTGSIFVAAGEKIGTVSQIINWTIDLGVYDSRIVLPFISPDKVPGFGSMLHTACFTDYLAEPDARVLRALMGEPGGEDDEIKYRIAEPVCGDILQDILGTAQGLWYLEPWQENAQHDVFYALVHDNIDPNIPVFSIGYGIESIPRGQYSFSPKQTGPINADFDRVRPDGTVYCYEMTIFDSIGNDWPGYRDDILILLQMPSENELLISGQEGHSCGSNYEMPADATLLVR